MPRNWSSRSDGEWSSGGTGEEEAAVARLGCFAPTEPCSISGNYGLKNVRDRVCDPGVMNSDFEREGRAHFHRQRAGPRPTT
jgi:hypothetical protein